MIEDQLWLDGYAVIATWLPAPFMPPPALTRQASGVCFCDNQVVLVKDVGGKIMLPGGTIEAGETFEQTLNREVWEEANAIVEASSYLGAQRFAIADHPTEQVIYQARYWVRVRLLPFVPQYEIVERLLVPPGEVASKLQWQTVNVLQALLAAAQEEQNRGKKSLAPL